MRRTRPRLSRARLSQTLLAVAALAILALPTTGCTTVQPWERGTLAKEPMSAEEPACKRFEFANEVYREGAVGANGGKAGGGCGCT